MIPCKSCGRPLPDKSRASEGRVHCSRRCASRRIAPVDRALERELLALLDRRAPRASLCPSEIARAVDAQGWRSMMEPARRAGRRLAARGLVEFAQRGRVVDPATVRGPVRIRRGPAWNTRAG